MGNELLYEVEYQLNKLRKSKLNKIKNEDMRIKDLLDLGFDNSFIEIEDYWYNLGYKWKVLNCKTNTFDVGYESNDFGELNDKQLNCIVKYVDEEISDYNYQQVSVELVNEEDKKYFLGDE